MKRLALAASLAALSASAAADIGLPYEQSQVDRQVPSIAERSVGTMQANAFANDFNFIAPAQ